MLNVRDGKILGKISTNIDLKDKIYENILEVVVMAFYNKHPIPQNIVFSSKYENESNRILEALKKDKNKKRIF